MEKLVCLLTASFIYASAAILADDSSSDRIINGYIAAPGQFPYVASLQRTVDTGDIETRGHVCGGILFTLQRLLTAGRCTFHSVKVDGENATMLVPIVKNEYRVFVGTVLTNDTAAHVTRQIEKYLLHPEYTGAPAFSNDIAIITLVAPFPASIVTPLPLPSSNFRPADETPCTIAGWGANDLGSTTPSTQLRFGNKYIYNQDYCATIYNYHSSLANILSTTVCASTRNVITTGCVGDEGNGLVCNGTLTGISFMTNACYGSSYGYPEVFTRISNYTAWIQNGSTDGTGAAPTFKPAVTLIAFIIFHATL